MRFTRLHWGARPLRYSTLAGFLEIGETLEQALVREVAEESGVAVDIGSVRCEDSNSTPLMLRAATYTACGSADAEGGSALRRGL